MSLEPHDLIAIGRVCTATLQPAADADWSLKAGDLEWDCHQTLDHMVNAPLFYATNLAMRSTSRIRPPRSAEPNLPIADLIASIETSATILARVAAEAPASARGFHPAGMADAEGFMAMGANELLIHTSDIASGLGLPFQPAAELANKAVRRLYPWAPTDSEPWPTMLWAAGRKALGATPRQGPDWWIYCAPLAEWDGKIRTRQLPAVAR